MKKGFTLVELMIVIAIIGILAAVLYPSITGYFSRARDAKKKSELNQLNLAIQMYYFDMGSYRISGTGDRGSGKGWTNYKGGPYYTKSIDEELHNLGYLNKKPEIILHEKRHPNSKDTRNSPCSTTISDPRLYAFHFDGDRYSFAAYLENATQKEKEHLKDEQYYGDGIDGTCTRYGRNYGIGN